MPLKEKIQKDCKLALKAGREIEIMTLRMLDAATLNKEKEKRYKASKENPNLSEWDLQKESQLKDEDIVLLIQSEIKKRRESVAGFEKGGRTELAEKEKKEIKILQKYLPEQLSEEEIKKITKETIKKLGAKGAADMGKVMKELMPQIKGKAEAGLVSKAARDLLS